MGKGGEFYLEDITPGKYELNLIYRDMKCLLNVEMPESDKMVTDLGALECKIN